MINWRELVSKKTQFGVFVNLDSTEIGTDWTFSYKDALAEFIFILLNYLRKVKSAYIEAISKVFGLSEKSCRRVLDLIISKKYIEIKDGVVSLTLLGSAISSIDDIIELETVKFVGEVCLNPLIFVGKSTKFIDFNITYETKISEVLNVEQMICKPSNLDKIEKNCIFFDTNNIVMYRINDMNWKVISESNNTQEIPSNENKMAKYNQLQKITKSDSRWFQNIVQRVDNFEIQKKDNKFVIDADTIQNLNKYIMILDSTTCLVNLPYIDDTSISLIRRLQVFPQTHNSAILFLLNILQSKDNNFWYANESYFKNELTSIWNDLHLFIEHDNPPTLIEIIDSAYDSKLWGLVKKLVIRRNVLEQLYR